MNDAELRALVRDAVARHLGRAAPSPSISPAPGAAPAPIAETPWRQHPSHHLYLSLVNVDSACVIEPSVQCNHCNHCKTHGY